MLIASSRKHIMWYKEEIEKLLPDIPRDKVPLPQLSSLFHEVIN
jgi:hypothetical protein